MGKTVSIAPESNDIKIAWITIKEMEKQKLVNYKGPINQA